MQNIRVVTITAPLSPLVHEDTNQDLVRWPGAHADPNYRAQAGTWLFPADVNALSGLRIRKQYTSLLILKKEPR
jgi:hypothetical protein